MTNDHVVLDSGRAGQSITIRKLVIRGLQNMEAQRGPRPRRRGDPRAEGWLGAARATPA